MTNVVSFVKGFFQKNKNKLTAKFCKEFGRVIIVSDDGEVVSNHQKVVLQAVPIIYSMPGKSITIEEDGVNYTVHNAGKGIYRICKTVDHSPVDPKAA